MSVKIELVNSSYTPIDKAKWQKGFMNMGQGIAAEELSYVIDVGFNGGPKSMVKKSIRDLP